MEASVFAEKQSHMLMMKEEWLSLSLSLSLSHSTKTSCELSNPLSLTLILLYSLHSLGINYAYTILEGCGTILT